MKENRRKKIEDFYHQHTYMWIKMMMIIIIIYSVDIISHLITRQDHPPSKELTGLTFYTEHIHFCRRYVIVPDLGDTTFSFLLEAYISESNQDFEQGH